MQPTYQRQSKTKLLATIAAIIVIAGIVLLADHLKAKGQTTTATTTPTTTNSQTATPAADTTSTAATATSTNASTYKDGTYTASSSYYVPHGNENIQVSLTVKNGVITNSSITNSEGDHDSARYQQDFASVYKSYVVGKNVSDLQLGIVAGASDTSQGFNDAVSQIASKAQA